LSHINVYICNEAESKRPQPVSRQGANERQQQNATTDGHRFNRHSRSLAKAQRREGTAIAGVFKTKPDAPQPADSVMKSVKSADK
jgi:hypothetical protein